MVSSKLALVGRHLLYREEEMILDDPLGKTKYYAIRVEFQIGGSPYGHLFLWILIAPVLNKNNLDGHAYLLDKNKHSHSYELITLYQFLS